MNLQRLNPLSWFRHDQRRFREGVVPVRPGRSAFAPGRKEEAASPLREDSWLGAPFRSLGIPSVLSRISEVPGRLAGEGFQPSLDVASTDDSYEIRMEAPGMDESDLSIEVRQNRLIVLGDKHEEEEHQGRNYHHSERRYGAFERVLSLPDDADVDSIRAEMKQGVLSIHVPRRAGERSENVKRITIH